MSESELDDIFAEFEEEKKEEKKEEQNQPTAQPAELTEQSSPATPQPQPVEVEEAIDIFGPAEEAAAEQPQPEPAPAPAAPEPVAEEPSAEPEVKVEIPPPESQSATVEVEVPAPSSAPAPTSTSQPPEKPVEPEMIPPAPQPTAQPPAEEEMVVEEAKEEGAIGIMIYGRKGEGKTALALSYPGTVAVLSFDRQALPVKRHYYNNDPRIKVYDAILYWNRASAEQLLETSDKTYRYINKILDHLEKNRPDVIVIDGSEIFQHICEMVMRYRNNLMPFQGISNRNLWKARNMYIDQVFLRALRIAKQAVICTAYVDKDEIIKEGETVIKEDVPRWVGTIMTDTRVVIRVRAVLKKDGQRFLAHIQSSKDPRYKTGMVVDITGMKDMRQLWKACGYAA